MRVRVRVEDAQPLFDEQLFSVNVFTNVQPPTADAGSNQNAFVGAEVTLDGIEMDHDLAARTETIHDREGHPTIHVYDDRGNIISTTDALGNSTTRTYDDDDNETSITDPLGRTMTFTYDAAGNQLSATDPLGNTSSNIYNERGDLLATINALGERIENEYDQSRLVATRDAAGHIRAM